MIKIDLSISGGFKIQWSRSPLLVTIRAKEDPNPLETFKIINSVIISWGSLHFLKIGRNVSSSKVADDQWRTSITGAAILNDKKMVSKTDEWYLRLLKIGSRTSFTKRTTGKWSRLERFNCDERNANSKTSPKKRSMTRYREISRGYNHSTMLQNPF